MPPEQILGLHCHLHFCHFNFLSSLKKTLVLVLSEIHLCPCRPFLDFILKGTYRSGVLYTVQVNFALLHIEQRLFSNLLLFPFCVYHLVSWSSFT